MGLKLRICLLSCLLAAAVFSALAAYNSLKPPELYTVNEEVYTMLSSEAGKAEYYLREWEGYVAVFGGEQSRLPSAVTDIEAGELRGADRAMLRRGIPVGGRQELLELLEDLGS